MTLPPIAVTIAVLFGATFSNCAVLSQEKPSEGFLRGTQLHNKKKDIARNLREIEPVRHFNNYTYSAPSFNSEFNATSTVEEHHTFYSAYIKIFDYFLNRSSEGRLSMHEMNMWKPVQDAIAKAFDEERGAISYNYEAGWWVFCGWIPLQGSVFNTLGTSVRLCSPLLACGLKNVDRSPEADLDYVQEETVQDMRKKARKLHKAEKHVDEYGDGEASEDDEDEFGIGEEDGNGEDAEMLAEMDWQEVPDKHYSRAVDGTASGVARVEVDRAVWMNTTRKAVVNVNLFSLTTESYVETCVVGGSGSDCSAFCCNSHYIGSYFCSSPPYHCM